MTDTAHTFGWQSMLRMRLRPMHRQVLLLATAQALFQTAATLVLTVGALAGSQIAPRQLAETHPLAPKERPCSFTFRP